MSPLTRSSIALLVAAGVNTLSVGMQLRSRTLERLAGRRAWRLHIALITLPWLFFLASLPSVRRSPALAIRGRRWLGLGLLVAAAALWLAASRQIGAARVLNGDAFAAVTPRRIESGPYRWLRDPIYDSYAVALAGWAFVTGGGGYLVLALESLIVLNVVEAGVESRALSRARPRFARAARWRPRRPRGTGPGR